MTQYTPPSAARAQGDIWQQASPGQNDRNPRALWPVQFDVFSVPRRSGVLGFQMSCDDFRGGYKQVGVMRGGYRGITAVPDDSNMHAASTLDSRFQQNLILQQLTTNQAAPDPANPASSPCCWVNVFGRLVIGIGNGTNTSLFKETSATDPTLVALTSYTAPHIITCLAKIVLGGYGADGLLVSFNDSGDAPKVYADIGDTPSVAGTMSTNLSPIFGAIQTPLNDDTILFYARQAMKTLKASDAINTVPTVVLTNVPGGGYELGMLALAGEPLRAFWVWPRITTPSIVQLGAEVASRVMHTSLEGTDPQELRFPLKWVYFAAIVRGGVAASDGERAVWHAGRVIRDLLIFEGRPVDSSRALRCRGFYVKDDDLYAEINEIAAGGGTGNTIRWIERYDFELDSWTPVSAKTTLTTTGVLTIAAAANGLPVSETTGFAHCYADGSWRRVFMPPAGVNPFSLRQAGAGVPAGSGAEFEASGTLTSPALWLPRPYSGLPFAVKRIIFRGDADAGGAAGSEAMVKITAGGVDGQFVPGYRGLAQVREVGEDELNPVQQLQLQVDITRTASSTRMTPQALPFDIEGYIFTDELPATDYDIEREA